MSSTILNMGPQRLLVIGKDIKTPINSGEKLVGRLETYRSFLFLLLMLASRIFHLLKITEFLSLKCKFVYHWLWNMEAH